MRRDQLNGGSGSPASSARPFTNGFWSASPRVPGFARRRLLFQLLTDSVLLAVPGGAAGISIAQAADAIRLVVADGLRVAGVGVTLGIVAAFWAGKWVKPLLFNVSPRAVEKRARVEDVDRLPRGLCRKRQRQRI